jgi:ribonuclease D
VLAHETLLKAARASIGRDPVEELLPRGLSQRRRQGALEAIWRGVRLPKSKWPEPFKSNHRRPTEAERRRFIELERRRDKHAHRLKLDPTLIASRADLARLAQDWDEHAPSLMKWQVEFLR